MKCKDLLHYILYQQKYRIISHDNEMNVVSKSNIIKNDNIYNRFNKDNEEYLANIMAEIAMITRRGE